MSRTLTELVAATKPFAKEDRSLSWAYLINAFAILILFVAAASWDGPWLVRGFFGLLAGLTSVRIFILFHDYAHGAIFERSPVAGAILSAFGTLILNPPNVWKRSHNYHHKNNQQIYSASIGSFPIMTVQDYAKAPRMTRFMYRAARHPLNILFGYFTIFMVGMCLKSFLTDPRRHWDSLVALLVHFALIGLLYRFAGPETLFFAFLLPLFVACALGGYLFYLQHNFPDMKLRSRQDWDFGFAALRASSYMEGSRLTHWFTGNIGYHHVHHLNLRIPFYNLPAAMAAVPELQHPGRTSLKPWDVYACLRLKLWDPKQDRMLGFREAFGSQEFSTPAAQG